MRTGTYSDLFDGSGSANRYYRSNTIGAYVNDNWKVRSNLTVTLGLRFDNDGAMSEKYGRLIGFNGNLYNYNASTDTVVNDGAQFAVDWNGASNTLMQNPQWGFAPRVESHGAHMSKITVREQDTAFTTDRGEYSQCEFFAERRRRIQRAVWRNSGNPLRGAGIRHNRCDPSRLPFGTAPPPPPAGTPAAFQAQLPNLAQTTSGHFPPGNLYGPFLFGGYDITNKLPSTQNWTFDVQYQASNNWLFSAAYVGNHSSHLVLPIPFNQPGIATTANPINGQTASYGGISPVDLTNEPIDPAPSFAGNAELRVPYLGYDMNSRCSARRKAFPTTTRSSCRCENGFRSALPPHGNLFIPGRTLSTIRADWDFSFTGNNPATPQSSYGSSDFDQTHVFLINYSYNVPKMTSSKGLGYLVNGWTISGQTVAQSGQPYSVYDYSGSVGSLYYGSDIYIAHPIIPLKPGVTAQQAKLQGTTGINAGLPVLNVNDFYPQFVAPGTNGVPACNASGCDSYESLFGSTGRNTFRGPFQIRFDMGVQKELLLHEKYRVRFNATAFNIFNHPDFDAPNNDVTYFAGFEGPPLAVPQGQPRLYPAHARQPALPATGVASVVLRLSDRRAYDCGFHEEACSCCPVC